MNSPVRNTDTKTLYLPGWEFNLLLTANNPGSFQSALAAKYLVNYPLLFILYDEVITSRQALDNEQTAGSTLGWITGKTLARIVSPRTIDTRIDPDLLAGARTVLTLANEGSRFTSRDLASPDGFSEFYRSASKDPTYDLNSLLNRLNTYLISGLQGLEDADIAVSPDVSAYWQVTGYMPTQLPVIPNLEGEIGRRLRNLRVIEGMPQPPGFSIRDYLSDDEWRLFVAITRKIESDMIPDLLTGNLGYVTYINEVHKRQQDAKENGIEVPLGRIPKETVRTLLEIDRRHDVVAAASAFVGRLEKGREEFAPLRREFWGFLEEEKGAKLERIVRNYREKLGFRLPDTAYAFAHNNVGLAMAVTCVLFGLMTQGPVGGGIAAALAALYKEQTEAFTKKAKDMIALRRVAEAIVDIGKKKDT